MADLTTATTFSYTVQGNKRVVYCDISTGNTTADTIKVPLNRIAFASAVFRSSTVGSSNTPALSIDGTTISIMTATTGVAYTIKAEGH